MVGANELRRALAAAWCSLMAAQAVYSPQYVRVAVEITAYAIRRQHGSNSVVCDSV